jgi:hypothetical protein
MEKGQTTTKGLGLYDSIVGVKATRKGSGSGGGDSNCGQNRDEEVGAMDDGGFRHEHKVDAYNVCLALELPKT